MIDGKQALAKMAAEQLRVGWQCQCLRGARGRVGAVIMAVLFNEYADHMPVLLRVAFPGFIDIALPQFTGCAAIAKNGKVICGLIDRDRNKRVEVVYDSDDEMVGDMRRLADRLKLNDTDRIALMAAVKRWVVMDARVNHLGEKVA